MKTITTLSRFGRAAALALALAFTFTGPAFAGVIGSSTASSAISNLTTVHSTIASSAHRAITALSASIAVRHTYVGDLTYVLRHDGVTVWLMRQPGADMDEFGFGNSAILAALTPLEFSDVPSLASADTIGAGCTFGDTAGVAAGCAASAYRSLDPMRLFDGHDLFGDWTLTIIDSAEGDDGTLSGWSLSDAGAAVPEPGTLALSLLVLALSAMAAAIRLRPGRLPRLSQA